METTWRGQKTSILAVGAKGYVTFCKMHVFLGRGVKGKGGKGDRVDPIPGWLQSVVTPKGVDGFQGRVRIIRWSG